MTTASLSTYVGKFFQVNAHLHARPDKISLVLSANTHKTNATIIKPFSEVTSKEAL